MKFRLLVSFYILASIIFLSGCTCKEKPVYINTACPKFTKTLSITVTRYNDSGAYILWSDVQNLKDLAQAQKEFNIEVQKMNTENTRRMKEALNQN